MNVSISAKEKTGHSGAELDAMQNQPEPEKKIGPIYIGDKIFFKKGEGGSMSHIENENRANEMTHNE